MPGFTGSVDQALQNAVQHHQAGRLQQAEALYRQILSTDPRQPDALHLLGVLAGQSGNLGAAVELIRRSIQVRPGSDEAHRNLARILADQGRLPEAVSQYRIAVQLSPHNPQNWFALGISLRMQKQAEEAITAFERVIKLDPSHGEAYSELGAVLGEQGRRDESFAAISKAVSLRPQSADAHSNLAVALAAQGNLDTAEECYRKAISLEPKSALHRVSLGNLHARKNDNALAMQAYSEALLIAPDSVPAYAARGMLLGELDHFEEALGDHRRSLELDPQNVDALLSFANTLRRMGKLTDAEDCCRRALQVDQRSSGAWECLGRVLQAVGRFREAAESFRQSLALKPNPVVYMLLSGIARQIDDAEEQELRTLLARPDLPPADRVSAGFALGKALDQSDRFDEAFEQFSAANLLYKQLMAAQGERFDADDLRRTVNDAVQNMNPDFFKARHDWGESADLPVFIVGMPRSGTTLVEQIASSHSKVFGAGELNDFSKYSTVFGSGSSATWDRRAILDSAKQHLHRLSNLADGAARVIDKMPGNLLHLGLIATFFPKARVIFCQRDPRDNCLSCFFQLFSKNHILFSYDLVDCAAQYLEQERLTTHWSHVLPLRMLTVQYEDLVADLEGQSRRIIDFLGLDWEPACLDFYKTERPVMTASVWQVRQPIYTKSVGRWKHYEKHLGPLLNALQMQRPSVD